MTPFEMPWGNYLLKDLVEAPPPTAIDYWPQTPGWYLLALLLLFSLFRLGYRRYQGYQNNAYRREALRFIRSLPRDTANTRYQIYQQLPALLRATAISGYGRNPVANLTSKRWELWLDENCRQSDFRGNCPNYLHALAYGPEHSLNPHQLTKLLQEVQLWIQFHPGALDD
ncbi:DUF4381 domain-containing protein [Thalassotalea mangrovi]|uniref:DUF4381 domain-containing protein n=1 Tax=Thalassotalea mangrovi TaxID=2572245 RepID=A0A4U1B6S7_9GAMM|nr:DUF4381 domain-containing protein [Thalassotalea mangrovi]TKB45887.1 DUF4381 domain-containing protein [Thalassotalea mangrovi]